MEESLFTTRVFGEGTGPVIDPAAGLTALWMFGIGAASHALGLWVGSLVYSMETLQRIVQAATGKAAAARSTAGRPEPRDNAAAAFPGAQPARSEQVESLAVRRAAVAKTRGPARPAAKSVLRAAPAPTAVSKAAASSQPTAIEKPVRPDDLKAISGIGPKLEQVLNGLGIWSYAQIAAWTAAEGAWVEQHLGFNGRIARDEWLRQAAKLAKAEGMF